MLPRATRSANKKTANLTPPSKELLKAIDTIDAARLRTVIKDLCATNSFLKESLEKQWLVLGKEVVRYHADTDSEDAGYSDEDKNETQEQYDARHQKVEAERSMKPIKLDDAQLHPRFVECENCEEEFDLGDNLRGWCLWHPGDKEMDEDHETWWDWEEGMSGPMEDTASDSEFAEGYIWTCCQKRGDEDGCKETRHKSSVNRVVKARGELVTPVAPLPNRKER